MRAERCDGNLRHGLACRERVCAKRAPALHRRGFEEAGAQTAVFYFLVLAVLLNAAVVLAACIVVGLHI